MSRDPAGLTLVAARVNDATGPCGPWVRVATSRLAVRPRARTVAGSRHRCVRRVVPTRRPAGCDAGGILRKEFRRAVVSPSSDRGPAGCYTAQSLVQQRLPTCRSTSWTGCPARTGWCATAWRPTTRRSSRCRTICARSWSTSGSASSAMCRWARRAAGAARLRELYHAVVYCVGAATDRRLGIPGRGSAGQLVGDRVRLLVQRPSGRRGRRLRARRALRRGHRRRATSPWTWPGCWPAARRS